MAHVFFWTITFCMLFGYGVFSQSVTECPVDWTPFDNFCYFFSGIGTEATYGDARDACVEMGATLTSILSQAEQGFILLRRGPPYNLWIGLNDINTPDSFVWEDGHSLGYDSFEPDQPDNHMGGESCVHILADHRTTWNDVVCSMTYRYACKMKTVEFWIEAPTYIAKEGSNAEITIHRRGHLANRDLLSLTVLGTGTARYDDDYDGGMVKDVEFAVGDTEVTVAYSIDSDPLVEGVESFSVRLASRGTTATGSAIAGVYAVISEPSTTTVFLLDCSSIYWIDSMYVGEEGSAVKINVHRAGYLGEDTSIAFSVIPQTATETQDYVDPSDLTIDFVDGEVSKKIDVTLKTDALVEGIEYFQAELGAVTSASPGTSTVDTGLMTANIFILDLTSYFWIEEEQYIAFEETPNFEVTFRRGGYLGRTDTIMVAYTDARALDGVDYTSQSDDIVTFNDDVTAVTKEIAILPDNILEYNEMFFLAIRIPGGTTLMETARIESPATSEVIIKDPTWYVFDSGDFTVMESSARVTITIHRRGDIRTAGHVYVATKDISASSLRDYTPTDVMVTFDPGQSTKTVTINLTPDNLLEADELFQIHMHDPDNAEALGDLHKAIVTIVNDDFTYRFGQDSYTVLESNNQVALTVIKEGYLHEETTINVATKDISTSSLRDYTPINVMVTFAEGQSTKTVTINITPDYLLETDELLQVYMHDPDQAEAFEDLHQAIVTIVNDDFTYRFGKDSYTVLESSNQIALTVIREGHLQKETTIGISTRDVSASSINPNRDYQPPASLNVVFQPDETKKEVTFNIINDQLIERPEEFEVLLTSGIEQQLSFPTKSTVTINSDDNMCPSNYCQNGGVCRILDDLSFECTCGSDFTGSQCETTVNTVDGSANVGSVSGSGADDVSVGGIVGIGLGSTVLVLSASVVLLYVCYKRRVPKQFAPGNNHPNIQLASPFGRINGSQLSPAFPSLMTMPDYNYNGAYQYYT